MKVVPFVALAICLATPSWSQNAAPYTTVCISDKEGGFNWEKGDWVHARYKAGTKTIVQKIDPANYQEKNPIDQPLSCEGLNPKSYERGTLGGIYREACYVVRDAGANAFLLSDADKCYESYSKDGALEKVECRKMHFSPNGLFIKLPTYASMNLSKKPNNDYKDSLAILVGTCTKLE